MAHEKVQWVDGFEASLLYGVSAQSLASNARKGKIRSKLVDEDRGMTRKRKREKINLYRVVDIVDHYKLKGPYDRRVYNSKYLKEVAADDGGDYTFTRHLAARCLDLERALERKNNG